MGDQSIDYTTEDEDEVPELRKKSDDPVEGLKSTLRKSKSIRQSLNQDVVLERQVSEDVRQYVTSLYDDPEIISSLGGQDFTDLIEEYKQANNSSSSTSKAVNTSTISGPPPPPPGPIAPPPPPCLTLQAVPENRMVKLHWQPVRKEKIAETVWENLPEVKIDQEEIRKLFSISSKTKTKKPEEEKVLTIVNVLDIMIMKI